MHLKNGSSFEGTFLNGTKVGRGVLTISKRNEKFEGYFEKGKEVKWKKISRSVIVIN